LPAKVLVVDDDPTIRRILNRLLTSRFKAVVVEARNGEEGFAVAAAEGPDLILIDVSMPEVDGPTLLARLRQDTRFASTPVITISAEVERDVVLRMIELGVEDYISKPLSIPNVEQRLGRVLGGLPARR
jgi:CheY-like chemotaxis protein